MIAEFKSSDGRRWTNRPPDVAGTYTVGWGSPEPMYRRDVFFAAKQRIRNACEFRTVEPVKEEE